MKYENLGSLRPFVLKTTNMKKYGTDTINSQKARDTKKSNKDTPLYQWPQDRALQRIL
jgi:hypothetical protein